MLSVEIECINGATPTTTTTLNLKNVDTEPRVKQQVDTMHVCSYVNMSGGKLYGFG